MKETWPTQLRWRVLLVAGICLVGLVIAAAILQSTTSGLPRRTGVPYISPPLAGSQIVETMKIPLLRPAGRLLPVAATDGDLSAVNQPLEAVQPFADGAIAVHTMTFDDIPLRPKANGKPYILPVATVQGRPALGPPGKTWFDVTRWRSEPALVAARELRNGHLLVTLLAVRPGLPRLARGVAPAPPSGGARTIAVATWDGSVPDLFVFDRGSLRVPVAVRIYSGESGFRKLLLAVALQFVASNPKLSTFDVARVQPGGRPDIIFVKRRGQSGRPEAHILTGSSSFSAFDQHLVIRARPIRPQGQLVVGTRLGQATVYVVRLTGPVRMVSLIPLPYRANVPS